MTHRDLLNALLMAGPAYQRRIDSALQERHTMTRLGSVLEDLLAEYTTGALPGQRVTNDSELMGDPEYKECFEVAIAENAGYIFERHGMPLALLEAVQAVLKDECNEHRGD